MNEFRMKLMKELKKILGRGYKLTAIDVEKNNGKVLHGIAIVKEGQNGGPTVYADSYFKKYSEGENDLEQMATNICMMIAHCFQEENSGLLENIITYDKVKDNLRIALCNYEANLEMLSKRPHRHVLDLAVTAFVHIKEVGKLGSGNLQVTNSLLKAWGVSADEMLDTATVNTMKLGESYNILDMLEDKMQLPEDIDLSLYVLTTKDQKLGASMLFNFDLLGEIADKLDSNLFIYPSSIHEVLVYPDKDDKEQRVYHRSMVEEVNQESVAPEERLSNSVYYFDRKERELRIDYQGKPLSELAS